MHPYPRSTVTQLSVHGQENRKTQTDIRVLTLKSKPALGGPVLDTSQPCNVV